MLSPANLLGGDTAQLAALAGKTFLITGGHGMLGDAFRVQIERHLPSAQVLCLGKSQLDVRERPAFETYVGAKPDYVVHCAARVDADYCEDHADEGRRSIVEGTRNVVEFASRTGARLLYPQSFLINDGIAPEIDEATVPKPLGVYGELKLEAESLAIELGDRVLSVRMAGFFGGNTLDDNFVGRITPHFAKLIKQGTPSIDIGNRVWQPTYTHDLAANSLLLLAADRSGIYCMASHGHASFHDLAIEIVAQMGIGDRIHVRRIDASLLASKEKARRPMSAIMRNRRLQDEGLDRQRPWQAALAEYLDQPYFKDLFR